MRPSLALVFSVFVVAAGGAVLVLSPSSETSLKSSHQSEKPNIVLLMVDTLRADKLGTYGNPLPVSPEIDELATRGVVFEKVISQTSWTRPSVASLLTSVYPRKLGVMKEQWDVLREDITTLAEALKAGGYYTIGLTANPQLNTVFGFSQGFDEYVDSTVIFSWMKEEEGKKKANRRVRVRTAQEILDEALGRLRQPREQPVFLQLMLMDVHAHALTEESSIEDFLMEDPDRKYTQALRNTSRQIGRFIKALESDTSLNMQNTIVVLTSDHGEGLRDHPAVRGSHGHGNLLYRSQVHVPLIFYGMGQSKLSPHRPQELIPLLDLFPTVLSLAGVEVSGNIDGDSRRQTVLSGTPVQSEGIVFTETQWRHRVNKAAVVSNDWFYIEARDQWEGTAPVELQPFAGTQNGAPTNLADTDHQKEIENLSSRLHDLEGTLNLALPAAGVTAAVSDKEIKQLKSLGYLGK